MWYWLKLGLFLVLTWPFILVTPVHAETVVWDEAADGGVPKGVVGNDGIRCTAESTDGEHTYRTIFYIGADAGEMATDPLRERRWQKEHCQNHSELLHGFFWQKRGLSMPVVKISTQRV